MSHFIDLAAVSSQKIQELLASAAGLKQALQQKTGRQPLRGKILGMIFAKSSTRTRISFEVGMMQLGGQAIFLSTQDIQLGRGETIADTARVLSRFLDGIMIRTFAHSDVLDLARFGSIPIINGLTDLMHPCQALADIMTVQENFGQLKGLRLAYLGDGNNVANSLVQICAKTGMDIAVATPSGYHCDRTIVSEARIEAEKNGCRIIETEDPREAAFGADAVYTDTWISMGQEKEKQARKSVFAQYQVNDEIMGLARPQAIFLHCLPAYRGLEVTESVIDGPASKIFDQAENRLHAQKAVLVDLLGTAQDE